MRAKIFLSAIRNTDFCSFPRIILLTNTVRFFLFGKFIFILFKDVLKSGILS